MLKLADITLHANSEYADTTALLRAQHTSLIYVEHFRKNAEVVVIKQFTDPATVVHPKDGYLFFRGKNNFGHLPLALIRFLRRWKPNIVLIGGLIFPLQVIYLRAILGDKVKIIARHHADTPSANSKRYLQRFADKFIHAYTFTSVGNASEWLIKGVIGDAGKIYEMPATLTSFERQDKMISKQITGMHSGPNYLWVGRLNNNKDPLTVLSAFEVFIQQSPEAKLHLIFQTDDLLEIVCKKIEQTPVLRGAVLLHGKVAYEQLPFWFSAAEYYISSSYSEGGSSAILEAMACGCIPIVSHIPASMKVIGDGKYGLFFSAGNIAELWNSLQTSAQLSVETFSQKVMDHYHTAHSPAAVAKQLMRVCEELLAE